MNKSELIEALSGELKISTNAAASIANTILNTMTEALVKGEHIEIRGFGSFMVRDYKSYTGKNPKTGETVKVKPKKLPFFKVGKDLKEAVDAGRDSK